jgi:hypothetical protein
MTAIYKQKRMGDDQPKPCIAGARGANEGPTGRLPRLAAHTREVLEHTLRPPESELDALATAT